MFRRRKPPASDAPDAPWLGRVAGARQIIESRQRDDPRTTDRLDAVEAALGTAAADLVDLDEMIGQLDPERATRELKDLLRRQHRNPTAVDDRTVTTMRRRYETIHGLQDRRAALVDLVERTIADLEGLAASSFELDRSSRDRDPSRDLSALNDDLAALVSAHAELDAEIPDLSGGR